MGNPQGTDIVQEPKRLIFDEAHYNKFEREDKNVNDENESVAKRKR
jgi:hypothetical protein